MKQKYIVLIIVILLISLSLSLSLSLYKKYENFENNDIIELIVARYNEDLEWLKEEPFNQFPVIIYNKGENDNFFKPPLLKEIINLPNVGVCDHTYIYHIIKNYDNLANITIFLPGSCSDNHKIHRTMNVIQNTVKTNDSVIYAYYSKSDDIHNFSLDKWLSTNDKNKELNNDSLLRKCDINPYGKWLQEIFPNISSNNHYSGLGIFSVSRKHIHNRSKESYKKILKFINKHKNEECSHYVERSYIHIFHPIPKQCIYA